MHISYSLVCDGREDCPEGNDEQFCRFPLCSGDTPLPCGNTGKCLPLSRLCDGQKDCRDGTEDSYCHDIYPYPDGFSFYNSPPPPAILTLNATAWQDDPDLQPLPQNSCPETHFNCPDNGYCLPIYLRCNGVFDCPGHEDEGGCLRYNCPGYYRCRGAATCLHASNVCDGLYQCPDQDDEVFCDLTCPDGCTCHGLAFLCHQFFHAAVYRHVRYLDASHSGMAPPDLVSNEMIVFLCLASCGLKHLTNMTFRNLQVLDVANNNLHVVMVSQLSRLSNLKSLVLAGNPVSSDHIFADSRHSVQMKSLTSLDLSRIEMPIVHSDMFSSFSSLESINFTHSRVESIAGRGLSSLTKLRYVYLRGCPMNDISSQLFLGLSDLTTVYGDNYKLCCSATLPEGFNLHNCYVPFDDLSSCEALLRSNLYRIVLSVFACLSLAGNLGSFLLRLLWFKNSRNSGFAVFVSNLSLSDMLMGMYLAIVGIADRLYLGTYLWEDQWWRHSGACAVAGFLSLLSSEVSAFIVVFITLDRFLALRFPFSSVKFHKVSATITCLLTWAGCGCLAAVPLLAHNAHWQFYSQTGICIPLPITSQDFPGHSYAFGVIIILNFVLFLLIASGQVSIFITIQANAMTVSSTTNQKSKDMKIARRLITIAVSDFLCWFPIGLLGVLASKGTAVPGEVNVAMAIVALPINSALNPFLYNLNVVLEKRRRLREDCLLKAILEQQAETERG